MKNAFQLAKDEELQSAFRSAQRIAEMTREAQSAAAETIDNGRHTATAAEALARDAADAKRDSSKALFWSRMAAWLGAGSLALAALDLLLK